MATKNNPGKYDCYANAAPDEPLFVLLARDPVAPALVRAWAYLRSGQLLAAELEIENAAKAFYESGKEPLKVGVAIDQTDEKYLEACVCASAMEIYRRERQC